MAVICISCGTPLAAGDDFCGNCGKRREDEQEQFFSHAAIRTPPQMSNVTRYLCAAGHLDQAFERIVLREFLEGRRAVVPSRGIDLVPVIGHCLTARKMRLIRDLILTCLFVVGILVALLPMILTVLISIFLTILPVGSWHRRSFGVKTIVAICAGLLIAAVAIYSFFDTILFVLAALGTTVDLPSLHVNDWTAVIGILYFCAVAGTLFTYGWGRYRTLTTTLRPGAPTPRLTELRGLTESCVDRVDQAQYGNLTIYGGDDPFLGTGGTPHDWRHSVGAVGSSERAWSVAIELDRDGSARGQSLIDPVELHQVLRRRLLELNDHGLSASERVTALTVDDHVVGEGRFEWSSPLVDPQRLVPYSQASQSAVEALIRNPQARLRYYQRVSISDEGQAVLAGGQPVIDPADQEIVVSAFIYVAVEGHMFYLQFVPTSLYPIADQYHLVDRLPRMSSGRFTLKVVLETARTAFRDMSSAPFRVVKTLWRMWQESQADADRMKLVGDTVYADIGARISVRQLAALSQPRTYIQQLDVTKYTQMTERLVLETVLDYLVAQGVDTAAYRASAQAIYNSGIYVAGDVSNSTLTATTREAKRA